MSGFVHALLILAAVFVVPMLMMVLPGLDPLIMIVGLALVLAGMQKLSAVSGEEEQGATGDESQSQPQSSSGTTTGNRRRNSKERAGEGTPEDILKDAEACISQNNYARAQDLARKVTCMDPENAKAWELLATALKWDDKRDEAAETVRKARDDYEVKSDGLEKLAQELKSTEDPVAVAKEFEERGDAFIGKNQYDLAGECFTRSFNALAADDPSANQPQLLRLLRRIAECAQQLEDWNTCFRAASAVLAQEPTDTGALLLRAAANEAFEKWHAAIGDAKMLLALDPKNAAANRIIHNCQVSMRAEIVD